MHMAVERELPHYSLLQLYVVVLIAVSVAASTLCIRWFKSRNKIAAAQCFTYDHDKFLPALSRGSIEVDSQSDGSMSDDPQADFAAMRASVVAKKASNFSTLSAVQSAASSRNFRSHEQLNKYMQAKSMESMPKMGIPPKKLIANYLPFCSTTDQERSSALRLPSQRVDGVPWQLNDFEMQYQNIQILPVTMLPQSEVYAVDQSYGQSDVSSNMGNHITSYMATEDLGGRGKKKRRKL